MSPLSRLFRRSSSEDYEQVLSALAADVHKRQTRLAEIRLRERRMTLHFTLGTILLLCVYVGLWYARTLPQSWRESALGKAAVLVGLILILLIRRMMQIWYSWKGGHEEKILRAVLKKQRDKVEEIKKKTNYYSTRDLLEKYDEKTPNTSPAATPLRRRNLSPTLPLTPASVQAQQPQYLKTPNGQPKLPLLQLSPIPQPIQATRKPWYDKLADAILGVDESSVSSPASRYALICQKCFAHNGLVKESCWEDQQFTCFKCGFLNPSARSKKQAGSRTPSPPASGTVSAKIAEEEPSVQRPESKASEQPDSVEPSGSTAMDTT